MSKSGLLLALTMLGWAGGAAAAAEPTAPAPAVTERRVRITVALVVNGAPAGDVGVETTASGDASVDAAQLLKLLDPILSRAALDELRAKAGGRAFVPLAALSGPGFQLGFDVATLQLKAVIPVQARADNGLSVTEAGALRSSTVVTPPAERAYGVTLTFAQRINHENDFRSFRRDPATLSARGFLNFGGIDGVNVTFLGGIREHGDPTRQRLTVFHDDVSRAIRYSAGDIDPQPLGSFGAPSSVIGLGVQRLYDEIQPYRNLRPAGRGRLAIAEPSRVEVIVNGATVRQLTLAPGQYNLRDFPFLDGVNDVRLVVRDDSGRQETVALSFFTATELLDQDISIFSAVAGLRRRRFGEFTNTRYSDTPTFSGFYRRGVTDRLTLGGSLEADPRNALATGQLVLGTPIGILAAEGALDLNRAESAQVAALFSYRYRRSAPNGRQSSFDLDFQYRSRRFSPMEAIGADRNPFRYEISARYQADLMADVYGTFGIGYSKGYPGTRALTTASAGLSRRFGRVNLGITYGYRHDGVRTADHRGVLSLSFPISRRQSARSSYETRNNRISADYDLQAFDGLDQTGARLSLARDDLGRSASGEVEHFGNRFRALVRHEYDRTAGRTREVTDVAVSAGFGYADGAWAIGREADNGFVVVDPHRSLRNAEVVVADSYSLGPSARSGALGAALIPIRRGYQPNAITLDVRDAPVGYDIGAGRIDILPGAASGYRFQAGSARSNTLLGRLLLPDGQPAALVSGTLKPLSGKEAVETGFFTNRIGRMVAQQLAPGRYAVMLGDRAAPVAEVTVPDNPDGPIDVGVLRIKE